MSRTFVEALKEKYCEDESENQDNFVVDIVFSNRPRRTSGSTSSDHDVELGYLTNVVLNRTSITLAGIPSNGLSSLCPNVRDLDIAFNSISDWNEVLAIFHHLPQLHFVNLSGNPLGRADHKVLSARADQTFGIKDLVLNSTDVTWDQAAALGGQLPMLQELHLCYNGYKDIAVSPDKLCESLPGLRCVRLNGNNISRWEDIIKLGYLPQLHTLILSDNPLLNIAPVTPCSSSLPAPSQPDGVRCNQEATAPPALNNDDAVFLEENNTEDQEKGGMDGTDTPTNDVHEEDKIKSELGDNQSESVPGTAQENVSSTCGSGKDGLCEDGEGDDDEDESERVQEVGDDDVIEALQALSVLCVSNTQLCSWNDIEALRTFPKLTSLKIKDIPLANDAPEEHRRQLFVASLPNVDTLNGSEVTPTEVDKSERHFVRYFSDKSDPPKRYKELVEKYGELKSYSTVDIGHNFTEYAHLSFVYGGRCIHQEAVHVTEQVGTLKKLCSRLVRKAPMFLKIYHLPRNREDSHEGAPPELQELVLETLPMSRYDMLDGDEIHIDVSSRPQPRGAALIKQGPCTLR